MRFVLLPIVVAVLAGNGCSGMPGGDKPGGDTPGSGGDKPGSRLTVVRFAKLDSRAAASAKDTIIRTLKSDTFVIHLTLPDSCFRPNPPVPPCPPMLKAAKTDTIIRQ